MDKKTVRIQKALSDAGALSRRKTEEYIAAGRVTVNGRPAKPGHPIIPGRDIVAIDGKQIELYKKRSIYIMLNKPRGYMTTMSDELGRRCVADLVADLPLRVYPVGRLDRDSEGLLLMTNDGEFANQIMHPRGGVGKTYRVTVRPDATDDQLVQLSAGVQLDDGPTLPATVHVVDKSPGRTVLQLTIYEGRNRQVRRMCEAVGLEVARLKRTAIGPLKLGMLEPGKHRELKPSELIALRNAASKRLPDLEEAKNDARADRQGRVRTGSHKKAGKDAKPESRRGTLPRAGRGR